MEFIDFVESHINFHVIVGADDVMTTSDRVLVPHAFALKFPYMVCVVLN